MGFYTAEDTQHHDRPIKIRTIVRSAWYPNKVILCRTITSTKQPPTCHRERSYLVLWRTIVYQTIPTSQSATLKRIILCRTPWNPESQTADWIKWYSVWLHRTRKGFSSSPLIWHFEGLFTGWNHILYLCIWVWHRCSDLKGYSHYVTSTLLAWCVPAAGNREVALHAWLSPFTLVGVPSAAGKAEVTSWEYHFKEFCKGMCTQTGHLIRKFLNGLPAVPVR